MLRMYPPYQLFLCFLILAVCSHTEVKALEINPFFSKNYQEAREKFMEAAQKVGAGIESFQNPHTGPKGEPLYLDVAAIGSKNASDILVLSSGTHGVEGFAGSGIQVGLLRGVIQSELKPNVGILMIHAVNPYGFAHLRRSNEDNVDLNRNFTANSKLNHKNEGYAELADVISPQSISVWETVKLRFHLLLYRLRKGKAELQQAISGGQYQYPHGIFFGGHFETWSVKTLKVIAKQYLSSAKRVTFIDIHTGLGPHGYAEIIMNVPHDDPSYKRAVKYWGNRVRTTVKDIRSENNSASVHLPNSLKLAIPDMLPKAEVTAVSVEYGTYPAKEVLLALRAENWLHHYGGSNHPKAQEIKSELLRVFYPDTEEWNRQVWRQGKEIVEQALSNF